MNAVEPGEVEIATSLNTVMFNLSIAAGSFAGGYVVDATAPERRPLDRRSAPHPGRAHRRPRPQARHPLNRRSVRRPRRPLTGSAQAALTAAGWN